MGQGGKEGARAEREGQDGAREGRKVSESEVKGMSASTTLTTKLIISLIIDALKTDSTRTTLGHCTLVVTGQGHDLVELTVDHITIRTDLHNEHDEVVHNLFDCIISQINLRRHGRLYYPVPLL